MRTVSAVASGILIISFAAHPAAADTLHVPGEYPTIQSAIDAAMNGDTVELQNMTYTGPDNRHLNFQGKAITVRSVTGLPFLCIIDGEDQDGGVIFNSGEGPDSVLEGIAITRIHSQSNGGGLVISNSSPTINNCMITYCSADGEGGGVYCQLNADPAFIACTFGNNEAASGAGISMRFSADPSFTGCIIVNNNSPNGESWGGGVNIAQDCNPSFLNCIISGNVAGMGGGVSCAIDSLPVFINCKITGNLAAVQNTGGRGGGIMISSGSDAELINCLITDNQAQVQGGGISCDSGIATFSNCTVVDNSAPVGPGLACDSLGILPPGSVAMNNCIMRNGTDQIVNIDDSQITLTFCNVEGGFTGQGNIDADPLFTNPGNGQYLLGAGSPCIDAGDNTAVPADSFDIDEDGDSTEAIPFDLGRQDRFRDDPLTSDTGNGTAPVVDMGAYEYQPPCRGDINGDGNTNQADLGRLLASYGLSPDDPDFDPAADLNGDGIVGQEDLGILLADYNCQS